MKTVISLILLLASISAEAQVRADSREYYNNMNSTFPTSASRQKADLEKHREDMKELKAEFDQKSYESLQFRQEEKKLDEQYQKLGTELDQLEAKKGLSIEKQRAVDNEKKRIKKERESLANRQSTLKYKEGKLNEELKDLADDLQKARDEEKELMKLAGETPKEEVCTEESCAEQIPEKLAEGSKVNQAPKHEVRPTSSKKAPVRTKSKINYEREDLSKPWVIEAK